MIWWDSVATIFIYPWLKDLPFVNGEIILFNQSPGFVRSNYAKNEKCKSYLCDVSSPILLLLTSLSLSLLRVSTLDRISPGLVFLSPVWHTVVFDWGVWMYSHLILLLTWLGLHHSLTCSVPYGLSFLFLIYCLGLHQPNILEYSILINDFSPLYSPQLLVITLKLVIYSLTYQNLLQIYTNLIPVRYGNVTK